jgi:hypothetical protein
VTIWPNDRIPVKDDDPMQDVVIAEMKAEPRMLSLRAKGIELEPLVPIRTYLGDVMGVVKSRDCHASSFNFPCDAQNLLEA